MQVPIPMSVSEIVDSLSPLEEATDKLQGQNMITATLAALVIRGLRTRS